MDKNNELIKSGRKKIIMKVLLIVICCLFLAALAFVIYINAKLDRISFISDVETDQTERLSEDTSTINILVLGTDKKIEGTKDVGRSDSTTLCSFNLLSGKVKVISFERGIPIYVKENYDFELLTHVYSYLGAPGMVRAIQENFDLPVDGYVLVDFDTFPLIVDAIGGIDIELTQKEADAMNGIGPIASNVWPEAEMHEGINHLSGYDTLQYCRLRTLDDNYGRQQRQRNAIEAMLRQLRKLSLFKLNDAANELLPLFNTNLSKRIMTKLLFNSPRFFGVKIQQLQVPEKEYSSAHTMDIFSYDVEKQRIREFMEK